MPSNLRPDPSPFRQSAAVPRLVFGVAAAASSWWIVAACSDLEGDYRDRVCDPATDSNCPPAGSSQAGGDGPGGAGGPTTTTANGGAGGTGGAPPECNTDAECTDPAMAKCDTSVAGGTCVACDASPQCEGIAATPVCATSGDRVGTCVACTATEAGACTAMQTCNLLDETCADVAPTTVDTCEPCTNDDQCLANHRCVPMDFPVGTDLGHFCLEDATLGTCERPYLVFVNEPSINDVAATNYCGIDQDSVTCPAVIALSDSWQCPGGTDGMCSPDSNPANEVMVPGAICEQVGAASNRCTHPCSVPDECPASGPPSTCGNGGMGGPEWCGG
ncbi:MAG: hypothetical protein AAF715_31990 [Myxococcota bacterium]